MQVVNDKNQICFVVWSDKIEGRLDPFFYKAEFRELNKKIKTLKYKTKQIKDFADVICGPFGSSIKVSDYKTSGIPLIRIANITKSQELIPDNTVFITKKLAEKLKSYKVKRGDLIVSQRGTLGLLAKIPDFFDGGIISANFIAIKNIKEVLPDYLKFFLSSKYGQQQLVRKTSGQIQTKITTDDIKSILVPLPPLSIQNQIVELMESAYKQKKEKEAEAEKLLNSIDDYVLDELGIKIPEIKDKMCFVVSSEEIENNRIDPYYHLPKFKEIKKAIEQGNYKVVKVRDVLETIKKGIEVGSKAYVSEGIPFVRVVDIDDYKINLETDKKINFNLYEKLEGEYKPRVGELLYSKDGTIGLCVVVDKELDFLISSGILRLKTKKEVNNFYLKTILSNKILKLLAESESIGQIIKHLLPEKLLNLSIPLPPLTIQNKIAEEVKSRIEKAKKLKEEAQQIIENAKKEVEKIILGN